MYGSIIEISKQQEKKKKQNPKAKLWSDKMGIHN